MSPRAGNVAERSPGFLASQGGGVVVSPYGLDIIEGCLTCKMRLERILRLEHRQSLAEIWEHTEVFERLRNVENLKGNCGCCEFRTVCMGCRARRLRRNRRLSRRRAFLHLRAEDGGVEAHQKGRQARTVTLTLPNPGDRRGYLAEA